MGAEYGKLKGRRCAQTYLPCIMVADFHPMLPSDEQDRNGEIQPVKGCQGRAQQILHSSPAKHDVDSLHPLGPNPQTPAQDSGAGGELRSSSSGGGHGEKRHPRNRLPDQATGSSVRVRPRSLEQHRHTPSLRGGMLSKGKGEKKRVSQRASEQERGREGLEERGEEGESGRLADVTSALNQSLQPWSHGSCPLMSQHLSACLKLTLYTQNHTYCTRSHITYNYVANLKSQSILEFHIFVLVLLRSDSIQDIIYSKRRPKYPTSDKLITRLSEKC